MAFACQFILYRLPRLPFGVAPAGVVFQRKIDKIFKGLPNISGMENDILIIVDDADGRDHNINLRQVMQMCHQENLILN